MHEQGAGGASAAGDGHDHPTGGRRRRGRGRRTAGAAAAVATGLAGGALGLALLGAAETRVGPVDVRVGLQPSLRGDTVVDVPPLGALALDTHDGPLALTARVRRLDARDVSRIVNDPAVLASLQTSVAEDARDAALGAVVRGAAVALGGAVVVGAVVHRRARPVLAGTGAVAVVLAGTAGAGAATWRPEAVNEPVFEGLLASAPTVVGSVAAIVGDLDRYGEQLGRIVANVAALYDAGASLPLVEQDEEVVRLLHVSDIHLNPAAWEVVRSTAEQFQVDLVVDSGDLTDHGSGFETRFAEGIATVGVPYVFVRGNHDSLAVQRAVDAQPRTAVLDEGQVVEVAGLRLTGWGDPRFTPDQQRRHVDRPGTVAETGERLAAAVRALDDPVDVAVVHDPAMALPLDGLVPLVLAGHGHGRETHLLEGGTRVLEQGSTGGAGLRGLEGEEPTPVQLSVLHLDRRTGALLAQDDVDLGGLGLASARIERTVVQEAPGPSAADPPDPGGGSEQAPAAARRARGGADPRAATPSE